VPAVRIEDVSKRFRIYHHRNQSLKGAILQRGRGVYEDFWALKDITFDIPEGKTFGLMGHNGSGKSTLLKCIAKILAPDSGSITARGRMAAMLEVGSGFHPELSGRENIFLNGAILGMSRKEIEAKFDDIVDFSGVGEFIDQPVKNYSSGMYVRLGFSVSIHVEPEILLVDEVLAVGDMEFQERCMDKFAEFREDGRTVVVVSHGLEQMRTFCDEVAWLDHGRLKEVGPAPEVIDKYSDITHGAKKVKNIKMYDVSVTDVSYLVSEAFRASHLVFASATYNNEIFPYMENLIRDLAAHNMQNRSIALVENGSWAPVSGKKMSELFSSMKNMNFLQDTVTLKSRGHEEQRLQLLSALLLCLADGLGRRASLTGQRVQIGQQALHFLLQRIRVAPPALQHSGSLKWLALTEIAPVITAGLGQQLRGVGAQRLVDQPAAG